MNANPNFRDPEDAFPQPPVEDSCPLCGGDFRVDDSVEGSPRTCFSCDLVLRTTEPNASDSEPIEELVEGQTDPTEALDRWLAGKPIEPAALPDTNASWLSRAQNNPVVNTVVSIAMVAAITILSMLTIVLLHERDTFVSKQAESKLHYERLLDEKNQQRIQLLGQVEAAQRRLASAGDELRASWAKRLAAHSQRLREKDPQRSLLLATEAIHATLGQGRPLIPEARQTLRDALKDVDGRRLLGHTDRITSLAISPDSRMLASGSFDKTVRLWDLTAKENPSSPSVVLRGHKGCVSDVKFSLDNRWLTTGSFDSTARVWDLSKQEPTDSPQVFRGHRGRIGVIALSSDSRWLVTGSSGFIQDENTVCLWDLSAHYPSRSSIELRGHTGQIHAVAVSPDNRWLLTAGEGGMARLWDLSVGHPEATSFLLFGHEGTICSATFTADSQFLVTGSQSTLSESPTLRLWRTSDRPPFDSIVLAGHESGIRAIATAPDSRRLISVGNDNQIRIWNLKPYDPSAGSVVIPSGAERVMTVAVSPDSRWLATGDADGTTRLWDLTSLDEQKAISSPIVFEGHKNPISKIAISPDNHWLVTATEDGAIHVRTLRLEELIDSALERVVLKNEIPQLSSRAPRLLELAGSGAEE